MDAAPDSLLRLKALFDGAMAGLEGVEAKRLFGCDGYFVNGNIFALVWKEGRLGLRFTDESSRLGLMALPGAESWSVGRSVMRRWVLVPVDLHARPAMLRRWTSQAWAEALERPPREAVTRRKGARRVRPAVFRRLP